MKLRGLSGFIVVPEIGPTEHCTLSAVNEHNLAVAVTNDLFMVVGVPKGAVIPRKLSLVMDGLVHFEASDLRSYNDAVRQASRLVVEHPPAINGLGGINLRRLMLHLASAELANMRRDYAEQQAQLASGNPAPALAFFAQRVAWLDEELLARASNASRGT